MAISFRADPAFANQTSPNTLDPSANPSSGDILIVAAGNSGTSAGNNNASSLGSDGFGGTWTLEFTAEFAARRNTQVWVNDDWTTATGTVAITSNSDQDFANGLLIVEGAESYTEDATASDASGEDWTPTLTGGQDAHVVVIQHEDTTTVSTPSGWTKVTQVTDADGMRSLSVYYHIGALSDTTPTFDFPTGIPGFNAWSAYFTEAASGTDHPVNPVDDVDVTDTSAVQVARVIQPVDSVGVTDTADVQLPGGEDIVDHYDYHLKFVT